MLKHTISYQNVDGITVTKDLYFNISSHELMEKEALSNNQFSHKLQEISQKSTVAEIYPMILEFIELGYGVRTEDGEFEKSPELFAKFRNSLAFQALIEDLVLDSETNGQKLANFLGGMMPQEAMRRAQAQMAQNGFRPGADMSRPTPPVAGQPSVQADLSQQRPQQPFTPPMVG